MHTVVETLTFLRSAEKAGMSEAERVSAVDFMATNPFSGEIIVGGGGARKVRVPGRGKGKSGGYRVLTYYLTIDEPVFLLFVINKDKSANLKDAQKAEVRQWAKDIRDER